MSIGSGGPPSRRPLVRRAGAWVSVTLLLVASCMVYDADLLTEATHQEGNGATDSVGASGGVSQEGGATGTGGVIPHGGTTNGGTGGSGAQGGSAPTGGGSGGSVAGGGSGSGGKASGGTTTTQGGSVTTGGNGGSAGDPPVVAGKGPGGAPAEGGAAGEAGAGGCPNGDCCPTDPLKTEEGECGCGMPDDDSDSDGTPDCNDDCPDSPDKIDPGTCGCDFLDDDTASEAGCLGLIAALVHRYAFEGTGTTATDSAGTANGTIVRTSLSGTGNLVLAGGADPSTSSTAQYVDLPNGIVTALVDATFEAWVTYGGSGTTPHRWQRIFDFGEAGTENTRGNGHSYIFFTPEAGAGSYYPRFAITDSGNGNEVQLLGTSAFPIDTETHVAVVFDDTNDRLELFIDGESVTSSIVDTAGDPATLTGHHLSDIDDLNNWLGRSQFPDYALDGTFYEFRIYDKALSAKQIATSYRAGEDAEFLTP